MSWIGGILNDLRDNMLTKEEIEQRKNISISCQMIKFVSIAAAVSAVGIFVLSAISQSPWAMVFGALFTGAALIVCYDMFRVADNMQQIVDDAKTEFFTSLSKTAFKKQLSHGTLFARHFIEIAVDEGAK